MRRLPAIAGVVSCVVLATGLHAQGLFESAGEDSLAPGTATERAKPFSLNGYVKGSLCGGQDNNNDAVVSAASAQVSLKLGAEKAGIGKAFAEVRLNAGKVREADPITCDLREAWAAVSPGPFDIKLGRQIVSWGRADAVNPTNNITPRDQTALSSEFDDTRLGNELLQVRAKLGIAGIQGIWVPCYRPDVLPLAGAQIPAGISLGEAVYPDVRFKNGGYALRLELTHPAVDGSVSYFNGYATLPGFDFSLGANGLSLLPHAYRQHVAGADFSTTIGSFGLRGEAALKYPYDDYEKCVYVPNPCAQYVLGIDKSIGNWTILLQYSGRAVIDYEKIEEPVLTLPPDSLALVLYQYARASAEVRRLNRLFTGASDRAGHALTGNVQWNTLHETLHLKLAGMYDFTTGDYALDPSVAYDIADAITLTVGGRYVDGPAEEVNSMVSNLLSFVYTEFKVSF